MYKQCIPTQLTAIHNWLEVIIVYLYAQSGQVSDIRCKAASNYYECFVFLCVCKQSQRQALIKTEHVHAILYSN